jgi:hypothetical protein
MQIGQHPAVLIDDHTGADAVELFATSTAPVFVRCFSQPRRILVAWERTDPRRLAMQSRIPGTPNNKFRVGWSGRAGTDT